ncbi:MAG: DNA-processing protein DprA [Propionibacteriaceae bacterium]|nr:DNA-processing protein DprA [Propionibacteriaceae bacterium]
MVDEEERRARLALSCVVEPGDLRLRERLRTTTPTQVWAALEAGLGELAWRRRAAVLDLDDVQRRAERHRLRFLVPGDPGWPAGVADLAHSEPVSDSGGTPLGLWVRGPGDLDLLTRGAVAVVGARTSTAYGDRTAAEIGEGLARAGRTVVSGGAFGIDAAAHRGVLAADGPTVAVLARGLDEMYPRAHTGLLAEVEAHGVLVSEVPPGEHPTRRRFLTRNRLIAALSDGVVVVEAGARSGARNTVTWASTLGRPVMAVPGPVSSAASYTPHRLIRDQEAMLVTCAEEVLEMVAPMGECLVSHASRTRLLDTVGPDEIAVYEALPSRGSRATGEVSLRAGLSLPEAMVALESLRARGMVAAAEDGGWKLGRVQDQPVPAIGTD